MKDLLLGVGCVFAALIFMCIPILFGYAMAEDLDSAGFLGLATLVEIGVVVYLLMTCI